MEFKQVQELIKMINKSNISELSIQDGEFQITIRQDREESEMAMGSMGMQHMMMPMQAMQPMQAPQYLPGSGHQVAHPAPPTPSSPADAGGSGSAHNATPIKSPMIGTFYRSSSPDKPSFVNVGDEIKKGQVLCIIEAMKLFNEIESEVNGRIIKVLADDASPVEYDQPLFLVEPI
jgi:acetyl-CoA carboxylase biotin carboxyl carrier protein